MFPLPIHPIILMTLFFLISFSCLELDLFTQRMAAGQSVSLLYVHMHTVNKWWTAKGNLIV